MNHPREKVVMPRTIRTRGSNKSATRVLSLLLMLAVAGAAVSCGPPAAERDPGPQDDIGPASNNDERDDSAGSEQGVTIRELADSPEEFYGERVTVSATVARVAQPEVFTLVSDEPETDEEPVEDGAVLVVGSEPIASGLAEEQSVRVTGRVREFRVEEVEQKLGIDLQGSLRADYSGEAPAILAESVSGI